MRTAVKALTALPLCGLLVWSGATSVNVLRADSLLRQANTEISTWAARGLRPATSTSQGVRAWLEQAEEIGVREPFLHELMGHLALATPAESKAGDGEAAFAKALMLRPVSAHTWASLAEARYRGGQPGRNLELPIEQAVLLGPSEPRVQRVVVDLGLATWREITPRGQGFVDRMLASGIRRNSLEMLRISERRGRLDVACRHVVGLGAVGTKSGRYCEHWEITP